MIYSGSTGPRKVNLWVYCGDCGREFEMHNNSHFGSPVVEMKHEQGIPDIWTSRSGIVSTYHHDPSVTFTLKNGETFTVNEFIEPHINGGKWHYEI